MEGRRSRAVQSTDSTAGFTRDSRDYTGTVANTNRLWLDLPSNVTFTTDSGVLLTQATAVPEPTTFASFGAALHAQSIDCFKGSGIARPVFTEILAASRTSWTFTLRSRADGPSSGCLVRS